MDHKVHENIRHKLFRIDRTCGRLRRDKSRVTRACTRTQSARRLSRRYCYHVASSFTDEKNEACIKFARTAEIVRRIRGSIALARARIRRTRSAEVASLAMKETSERGEGGRDTTKAQIKTGVRSATKSASLRDRR